MENIERLLLDFKESLEWEIQALGKRMDKRFDEINDRFDAQTARLERHAALLQTGSRWTARMNDWAENIDRSLDKLNKRVHNLENPPRPPQEPAA